METLLPPPPLQLDFDCPQQQTCKLCSLFYWIQMFCRRLGKQIRLLALSCPCWAQHYDWTSPSVCFLHHPYWLCIHNTVLKSLAHLVTFFYIFLLSPHSLSLCCSFRLCQRVHRGYRSELQGAEVSDSEWDPVPSLGLSYSSWAQVRVGWSFHHSVKQNHVKAASHC